MRTLRRLALAAALSALFLTPYSVAQTDLTKLYTFGGQPDGENPGGVVAGPNGVLYGATAYGGNGSYPGEGTVFALQSPATQGGAWTETVLYAFSDGSVYFPVVTPVVGANGALYGTTSFGGTGSGTVWELQPPATPGGTWTETVLYSFPGAQDAFGGSATALLMGANGALYGATCATGAYGNGAVFELAPPGPGSGETWTETDLYSLTGAGDGSCPMGLLIVKSDGVIYGTTNTGGNFGAGTVFELRPPAAYGHPWTETVLYSFTGGADGSNPWQSSLTADGGVLYGTTSAGGASDAGTVFELQPPAAPGGIWTETVLYSFGEGHGYRPNSSLIVRNGNIYGTNSLMVTGDPILGSRGSGGMVYELQKPAAPGGSWTEIILHHFENDDIPYGTIFMDNNGVLYATALDSNAPSYNGFVYKIVF